MEDNILASPSPEKEQNPAKPFDLEQADKAFFDAFLKSLRQLHFTESSIVKALQLSDLEFIRESEFPIYDLLLDKEKELHQLIRLFTLNLPLPNSEASTLFGKLYEPLCRIGVLTQVNGKIEALVDLHPCLGLYIATDHRFNCKVEELRVYYLGKDSYALGRGMPKKPVKKALDLCAGSGVHGILMAGIAENAVCADINPRAIAFIKFNARLNQIDNLQVCLSNLYEDIPQEKYDLILSNPPFVPDPTYNHYFNSTITGEKILQAIVEGLPTYLSEDGFCQIFTLLIHKNDHYISRIKQWLGQQMTILSYEDLNFRYSIKDYMLLHLSKYLNSESYSDRLQEWHLAAEKAGLTWVADGVLHFSRGHRESAVLDVNLDFELFDKYVNAYFEEPNIGPNTSLTLNPKVDGVSIQNLTEVPKHQVTFKEGLYTKVPITPEAYQLIIDNFQTSNKPGHLSQFNTSMDENDLMGTVERLVRLSVLLIE